MDGDRSEGRSDSIDQTDRSDQTDRLDKMDDISEMEGGFNGPDSDPDYEPDPMTQDQIDAWWARLLDCQGVIEKLVITYHPTNRRPRSGGDMAGQIMAERACEQVRESIRSEAKAVGGVTALTKLRLAVGNRLGESKSLDEKLKQIGELRTLFSEVWFGVPESMGSRDLPGFWDLVWLIEN